MGRFLATLAWVVSLVASFERSTQAQEVVNLRWPSKIAALPLFLTPSAEKLLPAFRLSCAIVPESTLLLTALSQPALLGISPGEAKQMAGPAEKRYAEIKKSPVFSKLVSAVGYCFSEKQPTSGFANLYLPKNATKATPVLLIVHGFAGSYQWFLHVMAEAFPDAIILAPAYGMSPYQMPPEYLFEAIQAAEKTAGFRLRPPTLVGLSAGVPPSFRAFCVHPAMFESMMAIAGIPNEADIARVPAGASIYFLAGGKEPYVPLLEIMARNLGAKGVRVKLEVIPEADHFFLLTRSTEAISLMRNRELESKVRR